MSSTQSNNYVTTRFGITLPDHVAAIINDAERHPGRGRELDRINAYASRIDDQAPTLNKKHCIQKGRDQNVATKNQFTFLSCSPDECPMIQSSIVYFNDGNETTIDCRGHVVSILPDAENIAVVILELPSNTNTNNMILCLCPVTLLDKQTIDAVNTSNKGEYDGRKM